MHVEQEMGLKLGLILPIPVLQLTVICKYNNVAFDVPLEREGRVPSCKARDARVKTRRALSKRPKSSVGEQI